MTTPEVPYRFEHTLEVPGTAEQVWEAIATAQGISAWMMPTDLEERDGGAVVFHMGPEEASQGRITSWEPPRRLVYEEDWAALAGHPGAPVTPLVTEFLVQADAGGTCVVRIVTTASGTGADWENEFFDAMTAGWGPILNHLRPYLTHFPGQRATPLNAAAQLPGTPSGAIAAVLRSLGADNVGEGVDVRGVVGQIEQIDDTHVLLRLSAPVEGFLSFFSYAAEANAVGLHLAGYLYSDGAEAYAEREQPAWEEWLKGIALRS